MPRPCAVCNHESRSAIEQAILNGKSLSSIAKAFGFTYRSSKDDTDRPDHKIVGRHRDQCMPDAYATAMRERQEESGVAIAARLRYLDELVDVVVARALKGTPVMVGDIPLTDDEGNIVMTYDDRLMLRAVGEGRRNADLLARLSGKTDTDPEDLNTLRSHLNSPQARKLLAELDRLSMEEADAKAAGER